MTDQLFFAPLEGITGYIYRNAHHEYFPGITAYMAPFLSPYRERSLNEKLFRDVLPENNKGVPLIPQILTNHAEDFIWTAWALKELGYTEVNLNLGCPSGTVVAKHKGAGFLEDIWQLDRFLEQIFEKTNCKISIKTRIGVHSGDEWDELLQIFGKYPIETLYIHPRLRMDFYKNTPNKEAFSKALTGYPGEICYNGDLFEKKDIQEFRKEFPEQNLMMIGRGFLKNPALHRMYLWEEEPDKWKIKEFYDRLCSDYSQSFSGEIPVLYKMKELCIYLLPLFSNHEKYLKKIKKANHLSDFKIVFQNLFREQEILSDL